VTDKLLAGLGHGTPKTFRTPYKVGDPAGGGYLAKKAQTRLIGSLEEVCKLLKWLELGNTSHPK